MCSNYSYQTNGDDTYNVFCAYCGNHMYYMTNNMNGRQAYCVITDQFGNQVTTDIATITLAPEMK